jgi:hypothetical protein
METKSNFPLDLWIERFVIPLRFGAGVENVER